MSRKSRPPVPLLTAVLVLTAALALGACGSGDDGDQSSAGAGDDRPTVVVTTDILGDVVTNLVGDLADVETLMPAGTSPHEFQASARQAADMRSADALVVGGAGFEAGMTDTIEAATADGVPTHAAIDDVATLQLADGGDHDEQGVDPHFFTDPTRMAAAVRGISAFLATTVGGIDTAALAAQTDAYVARLDQLDRDVAAILAPVPTAQRKLVTNHEVFGYFADRYDFEVVGAVIPSLTTQAEASAADLAALAATVRDEGVHAVFADTSSSDRLARALASEAGDVHVVELFSESLGAPGSGGETYIDLVHTNATRMADALAP